MPAFGRTRFERPGKPSPVFLLSARRFGFAWAAFLLLLSLAASATHAEARSEGPAWEAVITGHEAVPPRIIAVDKSKQQLFVLESRSPLRLSKMYMCTTGQVLGDKQVQGDLKTPEGIYFVVQHLTSGLDFTLYGNEAYTLNYPNPIDRLRKKTGYGIWIHGKGEAISPLQTQGCVALNNTDLEVLGKILLPGTPVALTGSFAQKQWGSQEDASAVKTLRKKVKDWAHAWGSRSAAMFDFYDKEAYSLAQGEPFSRFQAQKVRLFKQLPWIKTTVSDIQVLQGPGYWVTWFHQDYKAPNLSTKGIRRLYWGKNAKDEFRILGMEWAPGMSTGALLASAEPAFPPLETAPMSEEQAVPLPQALAEAETARRATAAPEPAQPAPEAAPETPPAAAETPRKSSSSALDQYLAGKQRGTRDHVEDPRLGVMAEPPQAKALREARLKAASSPVPAPTDETPEQKTVLAAEAPQPASRSGGLNLPPALPSQGLAGPSPLQAAPAPAEDPRYPALSPLQPEQPPVREEPLPAEAVQEPLAAVTEPAVAAPVPEPEPVQPPAPEPEPAAVAQPQPDGNAAASAAAAIEAWRKAWQAGNLNAYMQHYAKDAVQGSRKSAKAIRKQKKNLWAKVTPSAVELDNMRLTPKGDTIEATMKQMYKDSSGKQDKGVKTLILKRVGGEWLIIREEWSNLR